MKVEQIVTPDDIERYIEGCLNDFETGIAGKEETLIHLAELVVHIYKAAKREDSSPFKCPICGRHWDTNKANSCECGASIKTKL